MKSYIVFNRILASENIKYTVAAVISLKLKYKKSLAGCFFQKDLKTTISEIEKSYHMNKKKKYFLRKAIKKAYMIVYE